MRLRSIALVLVLVGGACATYSDRTEDARQALQRGDYDGSLRQLNKLLKVKRSENLPAKWKKNDALVILERATILQAKGEHELSARDFQAADKELELLDIARDGAGKIGKYIYSDSATKYKTSPTEKLALNAMNMCNYLARGDLSGAKVEARRFTVMRNYIRDYDPEHEHLAFGSYLAGFVHERLGNADEALRYYEEALQERDFGTLVDPIRRLAARGSYRGARLRDYLPTDDVAVSQPSAGTSDSTRPAAKKEATPEGDATTEGVPLQTGDSPTEPTDHDAPPSALAPGQAPVVPQRPQSAAHPELGARAPSTVARSSAPAGAGEILVVAKVGRVPYKIPQRIPIGAAIGIAGAFVTGDTTLLEYGMFKVVTYPELVPSGSLFDHATMRVDGLSVGMDLASDISAEIVDEYAELKPKIIGAALTRMIARAAAAEGTRAAGRQASEGGGIIGFLAAAAVEGTLVALDKPDTRSWTTLPARIYIGRTMVPAGSHQVQVVAGGPGGKEVHTVDVNVPAGGFVVVDVTTLR